MAENMKLNDEMMENAAGGTGEGMDIRTISGIVMVNPRPDDEYYADIWESCQSNGYTVYELSDGELAIADSGLPALSIGDKVCVKHIRGYYGWRIEGVIDGQ